MKRAIWSKWIAISIFTLLFSASYNVVADERIEAAVVKIYVSSAAPDYYSPWRFHNTRTSGGSGAIMDDNRIITNAHVIADATYIQVQKNGDTQKFQAEVQFVSHEADLAILSVKDENFFTDTQSLKVGELPKLNDEVEVYGYPMGGKALSITKGVLSRVEHKTYVHNRVSLIAGQIDAAINPGNSGGPVIVDGKIAGIAMQTNRGGENLGYMIPPSVIRHVLIDAEDGKYDGFPELGVYTQNMDSPAMKRRYKLNDPKKGVLVTTILPDSPAQGILQPYDVIVRIDGYDIADNQTIAFRGKQRTSYKYAIDQYQIGGEITFDIYRNGIKQQVSMIASPYKPSYSLVQRQAYNQKPQYRIYGGLVFVPLSVNLMKSWGKSWYSKAPKSFITALNAIPEDEAREVVVMLRVLPDDVNLGYHNWKYEQISELNGIEITSFDQFEALLSEVDSEFVVFSQDSGTQIIMEHQAALEAEQRILNTYRIDSAKGSQ